MNEPNAAERAETVLSSLGADPQLVRAQSVAASLFGRYVEIRERIRELKHSSLTAAEMSELAGLARELAELLTLNEKLREIGERIQSTEKPYEMRPIQCRKARMALGWGVRTLADEASVSADTVARFESGEALKERTVEAIQHALEASGVSFTNDDASGVTVIEKGSREKRKVREI